MANSDDAVISLYEASKRVGLRARARKNWTPFLLGLCRQARIETRDDDRGVPCCRAADVPRIRSAVDQHFSRTSLYTGRRVSLSVEGQSNG